MKALTIEVSSELEDRLQKEAARQGLPLPDYLRGILETAVGAGMAPERLPFYATATPEEWERAFREWAADHDTTSSPIPLETLRREHLYEDRA